MKSDIKPTLGLCPGAKSTTNDAAAMLHIKPQSMRSCYCRNGHVFGMVPTKLPNGKLLWDNAEILRLLSGEVLTGSSFPNCKPYLTSQKTKLPPVGRIAVSDIEAPTPAPNHNYQSASNGKNTLSNALTGSMEPAGGIQRPAKKDVESPIRSPLIRVVIGDDRSRLSVIATATALGFTHGEDLLGTMINCRPQQVVFASEVIDPSRISKILQRLAPNESYEQNGKPAINNLTLLAKDELHSLMSPKRSKTIADRVGDRAAILIIDLNGSGQINTGMDVAMFKKHAAIVQSKIPTIQLVIFICRSSLSGEHSELNSSSAISRTFRVKCLNEKGAPRYSVSAICSNSNIPRVTTSERFVLTCSKDEGGRWNWSRNPLKPKPSQGRNPA